MLGGTGEATEYTYDNYFVPMWDSFILECIYFEQQIKFRGLNGK